MIGDWKKWLRDNGAVVTPCGSRVTCDPAPTDTDDDYLVYVDNEDDYINISNQLRHDGWGRDGSAYEGQTADFVSWKQGCINLIVTPHAGFASKHHVATALCKRLNLMQKADRIAVFQAVLYGR